MILLQAFTSRDFSEGKRRFQIPVLGLVVFGVDSLSGLCVLLDLMCLII